MEIKLEKYDGFCGTYLDKDDYENSCIYLNRYDMTADMLDNAAEQDLTCYNGFKNVYSFTLKRSNFSKYLYSASKNTTCKALLKYLAKKVGTEDLMLARLGNNFSPCNNYVNYILSYSEIEDNILYVRDILGTNKETSFLLLCDKLPLDEAFKDDVEAKEEIDENLNKLKHYNMYKTFSKRFIENIINNFNEQYADDYDEDDDESKPITLEDDTVEVYLKIKLNRLEESIIEKINEEVSDVIKKNLNLQELEKLGLKYALDYKTEINDIDIKVNLDISKLIK